MPYRNQVLGADLDTARVDPALMPRVLELFATAASNQHDLGADGRHRVLERLAMIAGVEAALALEGDELERRLARVAGGHVRYAKIDASRRADRHEPPLGTAMPVVHANASYSLDDILDVLREVDADDEDGGDDDGVCLPYLWSERDVLLRVLAAIAPKLREPRVDVLVDVDRGLCDVMLDARQVICVPLHVWAEDPADARRFAELAGVPPPGPAVTVAVDAPAKANRPPPFDPAHPLVTGARDQRLSAARELCSAANLRRPVRPSIDEVIAAVRDPRNEEPRFDEVRRELYRYLSRHDTQAVRDAFVQALRAETDDVAASVIYHGWKLASLVAALRELVAHEDERTAARMRRLIAESGG